MNKEIPVLFSIDHFLSLNDSEVKSKFTLGQDIDLLSSHPQFVDLPTSD